MQGYHGQNHHQRNTKPVQLQAEHPTVFVGREGPLVRLQSKNLIRYQDTYAEQMAAYGLQRGIKGSEAQHISTHEYYRSLIAQDEDLQANITQLLEEQEKARLVIAEAEQAKKTCPYQGGGKDRGTEELSHENCHQCTQRSEFSSWRQQGEPTGERECPIAEGG